VHGIFDQLNWKAELSAKEERFSLGETDCEEVVRWSYCWKSDAVVQCIEAWLWGAQAAGLSAMAPRRREL
jgi:hypothetical protein